MAELKPSRRPSTAKDADARLADVVEHVVRRRSDGEDVSDEQVIRDHPELMPELGERLRVLRSLELAERRARSGSAALTTEPIGLDLPHDTLPGYELLERVARGGQGVVYRAMQKATKREVAIKVMREDPFLGPRDKSRFEREVHILAQLKHPNIVTIYDSGTAIGHQYFVMDYVAGYPLDEFIARAHGSIKDTLILFAKICEAVNAAHLRGIIHRDLKPNNIRVDEAGEPKILDFGLAKLAAEINEATRTRAMTITGQFVGSLPWASPEQADGSPERIDLRTDVYALGVVLFQALTGQFPYGITGKMREVLDRILQTDPVRPSRLREDIDNEVETIVLKCLAKDPDRRYQSAGELARDVRRYLADEAIEAKRDSTLYMLRKQARRYRIHLAIAAAFVVLIVAAAVTGWTLYLQSQRNLWNSYLAQARATRATDLPGRRFDTLESLDKAAAIRPSIELRNEAIAALALADLQFVGRLEPKIPPPQKARYEFSRDGDLFWLWDKSHPGFSIRRFADDSTVLTTPSSPTSATGPFPQFSPDGRLIAIASESGCEIWDIGRGTILERVTTDVSHTWNPFAFSADGSELAMANTDGSILIHDLRDQTGLLLPPLGEPSQALAYDRTGALLASTYLNQNKFVVQDSRTGSLIHTFEHPAIVYPPAWSPDGQQITAGCADTNVHVWDTATGLRQFTLRGHDGTVDCVGYNDDGDLLFSSDWAGATRLWDPRRGEALLTLLGANALSFFADSNHLQLHVNQDKLAFVVAKISYNDALRFLVGHPVSGPGDSNQWIQVSHDGRLAVSCSRSGVRIWDLYRGRQIGMLPIGFCFSAVFAPDDSALMTVTESSVSRWPIRMVGANAARLGPPCVLHENADKGLPKGCCVSRDGKTLYVAWRREHHALALDLSGKVGPRRIGYHEGARYIDVSPNGQWLATGSWGAMGAKVWNAADGELVRNLPIERDANVAFSPDGKWLVTSENEHIVWRTGTWEAAARFPRPVYRVVPGPITFSPDGRLLAVHGSDDTIELIDLARMESIGNLACPSAFEFMAFTSDGSRLVFPHPKRADMIHVWDLRVVRRELANIGLDWDLPPYPPSSALPDSSLRVEVDLGILGPET